nr:carboxylesterase/lipase family protein [Mucilaginibacter sp. L294]
MENNRRGFLQKLVLITSAAGLSQVIPAKSLAKSYKLVSEGGVVASPANAVVDTTAGKVKGYTRNKIYTFKGIPYAESTAGANRFLPPVKVVKWEGVRNTLVYGPICPQKQNTGWFQPEYGFLYQWIDGLHHEDCLRLNVWSPEIKDGKKRPVMFWMHGGGFTTGSSQEHPSYDGENLCHLGDVVVVSINHRLNAFGHMDLSAYGDKYAKSANVGMLDIVAALEWVRDNIGNFGGDQNNVTIYGQSGGGTKVITLMAMPAAKGLFHKAIAQSNSIVQVATPAYAQKLTSLILTELKIDKSNIDSLQNIPAIEIIAATAAAEKKMGGTVPADVGRSGLQPVVDGVVLPHHPFDPGAPAISANVPFMVGTTRNEASASIDTAVIENISEDELKAKVLVKYPNKGAAVYAAMRKIHPDTKPVEILSFLSAQNPIAFLQAQRKSAQKGADVYLYMFAWHTPVLDGRPRAFHCSEIPFVFGNTDKCENYTGSSAEAKKLSTKMAQAWISFARNGNPNHPGLPAWPSFNKQMGAMMIFNNTCEVKVDPDGEARQILERVYYNKEA